MAEPRRTRPAYFLLLLAACAVNLLPLLLQHIGGDSVFHLNAIHCYAEQFWQGDLRPRWCFEADGGVGSPFFVFYPPLPYMAASLLYPLHWAGAPLYIIYVLTVALATLLAAYAAFKWLRGPMGEKAALGAAVLYLFLPYRSEVMVSRGGLGELWVMTFAPLLAYEARQLLRSRKPRLLKFSLWTACALLSQPAVALCILIGIALHVLLRGAEAPVLYWRAALAAVLGLALTFFYALPALHYLPFTAHAALQTGTPVWANRYVLPLVDWRQGHAPHLLALAFTAGAFFLLAQRVHRRKQRILVLPERREAQAWVLAGLVAVLLLFPISAPFWNAVNSIAAVGFPWRMQALLGLALTYLAATYMRWLCTPRRRRTGAGDCGALILLLFCAELCLTRTIAPADLHSLNRLVAAHSLAYPECRTLWTSPAEYDSEHALARAERPQPEPRAELVTGEGQLRVTAWGWKAIAVEAGPLKATSELRIRHRYFPFWRARLEDGTMLPLIPEEGSGFMRVTLPPGKHTLTITQERFIDSLRGIGARRHLRTYPRQAPHDSLV